ncbi:MAG: rhodanese-like domain-containing protein [Fulvivirga sp.]|uniref:rhodanese-like domain-containing protein n=1 Tax=Fulvivirga sp. TaxID=1931237 RepID=UPI0032EE8C46
MIKNLVLIALTILSCTTKPAQDDADSTKEMAVARRLGLEEFNQLIKDDKVQLVDVRTPAEYSRGYINGAVNIDFQSADFLTTCSTELDKNKPLAIYCAAGGRSAKAMKQLKEAGFKKIYELGVGYNGYK